MDDGTAYLEEAENRRKMVFWFVLLILVFVAAMGLVAAIYSMRPISLANIPPRSLMPQVYKDTVHVPRFEDTVCYQCHRP